MDTFILVLIIIAIVTGIFMVVYLFFWSWTVITLFKTKVPFARTPEDNIKRIFNEINLPKNSLIYDLGCGDGRVLFLAEKYGYKSIGYELSLYPYLKAKIKKFLIHSQVEIYQKNFLKADLNKADAIFIFLTKKGIADLSQKLKNELKSGTIIISYGFTLPSWKIDKIIDTKPSKFYLYKK
ncbi:MAG: hypothetical protein PHT51_02045 [Patescibacteria group bacterium]|nr:hypothetical protein [Patescibacteria group bacterium]MDD4611010.1 hypothetical protein [Patescibacteria group bacterium]